MKIFALLFVFFFTAELLPQKLQVKSLKVYSGSDEISLPVIRNGSNQITIEFDVKSGTVPNMSIAFRFCDQNWTPYSNIFLQNQGKNIAYNLRFAQLPTTVIDANYHFIGSYPNSQEDVEFPFSGKWRFYLTDAQDTSIIYGSGKFYVVNSDVALSDSLKNEKLEGKIYFPSDLQKVFNITTFFYLPNDFHPTYVDHVEIIANHKIDYPIIIDRKLNTNTRQYYWDGSRNFKFIARDILPGNEYRETDLRNSNIFPGKDVNAHQASIEYSRFYKEEPKDLNGGSILTNYNDNFATYLNVTFTIRPPSEVPGIFLVGAFNNWKISPEYEMTNNYGLYSITIPLKRGIYDYQYVVGKLSSGKVENPDWCILEGNSWETTNVYHIFLYYHDPNYGGYNRIIGYKQITSK